MVMKQAMDVPQVVTEWNEVTERVQVISENQSD